MRKRVITFAMSVIMLFGFISMANAEELVEYETAELDTSLESEYDNFYETAVPISMENSLYYVRSASDLPEYYPIYDVSVEDVGANNIAKVQEAFLKNPLNVRKAFIDEGGYIYFDWTDYSFDQNYFYLGSPCIRINFGENNDGSFWQLEIMIRRDALDEINDYMAWVVGYFVVRKTEADRTETWQQIYDTESSKSTLSSDDKEFWDTYFAGSYMRYINNPTKLQKECPMTYGYIDAVVKGL